ncbi:MAG: chlorite dismutase family protein [candidate division Zixibacteria bacterium]|nr:chlorite dismutase family protein [candidate division Zixibacteria bacterium]
MSSESHSSPDMREYGAPVDGKPQTSDRRLYMQLQAYTGVTDMGTIRNALSASGLAAALYADAADPMGAGIVFLSENPDDFVADIRSLLATTPFDGLKRRPEMTMFGRSYATGYEPDLEDALVGRPRRTVLNPDWLWAIWYPLRRNGAFARLDGKTQREILMEHAAIGRAYGRADVAHDIRLACYGMDEHDNDFVIGLVGKALHPLSKVVQDMRKTQQTSLYIDSLGPFFIGKKTWASER